MFKSRLKKTATATAVVAAAVSGLSVLPAHADTPAVRGAQHHMAITLDHVALKVTSPDVPAGTPYVARPGASVQVASVGDLKPYRYLSVMAVPFGQTLPHPTYPFPASKAGGAAAWRHALHGSQNGPVATVFGQKVRGTVLHSHGNLTGKKGSDTGVDTIEWIVNAGGRTWVVNLQHDRAHLPKGFGTHLELTSADTNTRTTVRTGADTNARTAVRAGGTTAAKASGTSRMSAFGVATSGNLGRPSWWSSTCDGNGGPLSSSGVFMGLQVCGGGRSAIDNVPGVAQYEWQCADLSDRYLVQRYGLDGPGGNGNQEVTNWYNAYPTKFQRHGNGDGAGYTPVPGDVLSFATGASTPGHTGVVYKSTVNSSGNGTVYFVDQNWTGDDGYNSASVSNWNVAEITGQGGSVQWLHNPADSATPTAGVANSGNPAVGLHSDGELESVLAQSNGGIMSATESSANSGSFGSLSSLAASGTASAVTEAVNADGRTQLFVLQSNGGVATRLETSAGSHAYGSWSFPLAANAASQVVVGRHSDGRLEMIVVQTNGGVARSLETSPGSNTWGSWSSVGGATGVVRLALGHEADGRLHLFALQTNGGVADVAETGAGSGGWGSWGGFAPAGAMGTAAVAGGGSTLAVGNFDNGAMIVAMVQSNGAVATRGQSAANGSWAADWGVQSSAGAAKEVAVATHADGKLDLFIVQSNNGLARMLESSANGGWSGTWKVVLDANSVAAVNPVTEANGLIDLFVVQTNGGVANSKETSGDAFGGSWNTIAPAGAVSTS
ncbi:hypothetical protein [Streptomyces sp. NPDC048202]|uniref:hypothetical protein n=1 Tax=Streptomyces sp. NPDC048202 TaxID=3365514 RepID=UPI00371AC48E